MTEGAARETHGRRRRAAVRRLGEEGMDALLVTHPANLRYLTGFTGSAGMLLLAADSAVLVTDGRYEEQADEETAAGVEVIVSRDGLPGAVCGAASRSGVGTAGVEALHLTLRGLERLRQECPGVDWSGVEGWVEEDRSRKEATEVAAVGRAARLAEAVLEEFLDEVAAGATERELAARPAESVV